MADLTTLPDVLEKYHPELIHLCEHCRQFFQVQKLQARDSHFPEHTLYVGTVSQANTLSFYLHFVPLLLIEDVPLPPEFLHGDNSVLLVHKKTSPDDLILECQKLLEKRNYYLDQMDVLLGDLLKDGSLSKIVTTASGLLQTPLVVLDLNFKIMAFSSNEFRHDRQWLQFLERGYCSFEYITEFERARSGLDISGSTPFFLQRNTETAQEYVSRLCSHHKHLGYLIASETHSAFSRLDPQLYTLISDITANVTFLQNELEKTLTEYSRDHIILECLTNEFKTRSAYLERIRKSEFAELSHYQVVIIDTRRYEQFDPRKDVLRECFSRLFSKTWMLWFQGNVVTVIETGTQRESVREILEQSAGLFSGKNLRFSISDPFGDLYLIPQYYRQSLRALHFSEKLAPKQPIVEYNDYKCYDLLEPGPLKNHWSTYYSRDFQNLLSCDLANDTCYVETLYQYIICSKNLQKAARRLYIHKNTVSYRIARIRELFRIDLDSAAVRFQFLMSYHLKQLLDTGMLETEDTVC